MIYREIEIGDSKIIYASIDYLQSIKLNNKYLYKRWDLSTINKELDKMCRIALVKYGNEGEFFVYFIYWIVSKDLEELDQKIINNTFEEIDFKYAFFTDFQPNIICRECQYINQKGGLLYISEFTLGGIKFKEEKLEIRRKHKPIVRCPRCGGSFGIYVLNLF